MTRCRCCWSRWPAGVVVRAGDRGEGTGWMVAAGAALAVANAAAYSSALFDVVVLALALLTAWPARRPGSPPGGAATLLIVAGRAADGGAAARRPRATSPGSSRPRWRGWAPLIPPLSVLAALLVVDRPDRGPGRVRGDHQLGRPARWAQTALLAVLAAAAVPGPLEQARLHTLASLNKHVGPGRLVRCHRRRLCHRPVHRRRPGRPRPGPDHRGAAWSRWPSPLALGASQSRLFSTDWPNAPASSRSCARWPTRQRADLLVEDPSIAAYYLPAGAQWQRWSSTRNIVLPSGASTGQPDQPAASSAPATRRLRRVTSPGATSPWSR